MQTNIPNTDDDDLLLMITIIDREKTEKVTQLFLKENTNFNFALLAKGTAPDEILEYFNLAKTEKVMLLTLVNYLQSEKLKKVLINKQKIDTPGHGISFTIPISRVGGIKYKATHEKRGDLMDGSFTHELIITISNKGSVEQITTAARTVSSTVVATVLHGRGLGYNEVEKFLGITISPEKEVILMVTKKEQTKLIMQSILKDAGPNTKAKALTFAMPVVDAIGLSAEKSD